MGDFANRGGPERQRDIDRYRLNGGTSPEEREISDIGYPIAEGAATVGQGERDTKGYRRARVSQEEFREGIPLFQDSGFESIEEYIDWVHDQWRQANGLEPLLRGAPVRPPTLDEKGARQVGLRLPGTDYERLVELGERHGVAPATMARILVVRAVRAAEALAEIDD